MTGVVLPRVQANAPPSEAIQTVLPLMTRSFMKLLSLTACHSSAAASGCGATGVIAGSGVGSVISGVTGSVVVMAGAVAVGERMVTPVMVAVARTVGSDVAVAAGAVAVMVAVAGGATSARAVGVASGAKNWTLASTASSSADVAASQRSTGAVATVTKR